MIDAISKLVESGAISEDVQKGIQEAWDSKIKENKEVVGAELREEFAKRYEHDKSNMIEAIDSMMNEKLSEEIPLLLLHRRPLFLFCFLFTSPSLFVIVSLSFCLCLIHLSSFFLCLFPSLCLSLSVSSSFSSSRISEHISAYEYKA